MNRQTNNKFLLIVISVLALSIITGCADSQPQIKQTTSTNQLPLTNQLIDTTESADTNQAPPAPASERKIEKDSLETLIENGDYLKCIELAEDQRVACETNILTTKAVNMNDASWCEKATIETAVKNCQYSFNKKK